MRLEQLHIRNYRCFRDLTIELHPELTVLIAPNGAGKTTVLDAARVALWPFVKGFDLGSQTGKAANIDPSDVRLSKQAEGNMEPQLPSMIEAGGRWASAMSEVGWVQTRESIKTSTKTLGDQRTKQLTAFAEELQKLVREGTTPVTLPLISYLGTSRLWFEGRFTSNAADTTLDKNEYSRTSGYLNCLSYSSSFKAFTAWYGWVYRSYLESQIDAFQRNAPLDGTGQRFAQTVEVIKTAVDALVKETTGWHSLEYSQRHNQQLVMQHDSHGIMPVDKLSDGLRNAIAMVADLAFRAYKLNPHLGAKAALETPGVALIDEVDMFLHPSWQQTILGSLRKAFPMLQLIVSTHSPQVLTSVDASCIRKLHQRVNPESSAEETQIMGVTQQTRGVTSADVLSSIMGVDPIPDVPEARMVSTYQALIQQNLHDKDAGLSLRHKLEKHFGNEHPVMLEFERMIRLQAFKLRLPSQSLPSFDGNG
ncbi:AAA family ATPase [Paucibacter sp. Y2R2-4]|uniref:AAA family ATPase n=1 Tax=Paucibacter sp. Y2R2-4 TaxID=2893553 RepID=UPI0021E4B39E|nr:AAA family ATPase [Paucibacter sp. Y2R2-4]MCV2350401.1 AAA family ATPase [Paucibacter sp. Y2R2-4]